MGELRVLVIDNDPTVRDVLSVCLRREGYRVSCAADGIAAICEIVRGTPQLLILDVVLPGISGLELCRRLPALGAPAVILLSAHADEDARIAGLELGADDYVIKPFDPRELVARVRSVLRRVAPQEFMGGCPVTAGDLTIEPGTREARVAGRELSLTVLEFNLLFFLARHPRQVFTRHQLMRQVWRQDWIGDTSTVTVHMRRLREKIEEDPSRPARLHTVYGVGYRLVPVQRSELRSASG